MPDSPTDARNSPSPRQTQSDNARFDPTALAFCHRLAQQIIAFESKLPAAEQSAFRDSFRNAFRRLPHALKDKETTAAQISPPELAKALYKDPPAQARLASIVQYPPGKWILERELAARGNWPADDSQMGDFLKKWQKLAEDNGLKPPSNPPDVYEVAPLYNLTGLCFSGGGIRSATFNLGVLQGLAELDRLNNFDYLSTVSGGGYIHQFLASWIHCENLQKVQAQLEPLPGPPSDRFFWPEPLRWLRRYSNYLTPQVGLFTADTWVAVAIWLRNTFLNQIVVISTLLLILLLPHLHFKHAGPIASNFLSNGLYIAMAILALFLYAAYNISTQIKGPRIQNVDSEGNCLPYDEDVGLSQYEVLRKVLLPIVLAIFLVSPFLFRSAFWRGLPLASNGKEPVSAATSSREFLCEMHTLAHPFAGGVDALKACTQLPGSSPYEPLLIRMGGIEDFQRWRGAFAFRWWSPVYRFEDDPSSSFVFIALLLGIGSLVAAAWRAFYSESKRWILALAIPGTMFCGYLLIGFCRLLIFASSFFLPIEEVTRFNIAIVPLLGLTIVFVSIEIAGGLVGNFVDEAVREWFARLRAWSFLSGIVWFGLFAASLLGPYVVTWIVYKANAGRSVFLGWAGTTLVSVLLGKSSLTSGKAGEKDTKLSKVLNLLTLIGPPVFIVGLVLILSAVDEKALHAIEEQTKNHIFGYSLLAFFFLAIAVLFGWRIDINEFSLHAFYRDRLARCYAGASNPDRRSNRFTGFAASDKRLRLTDLLPKKFPVDIFNTDTQKNDAKTKANANSASPCKPSPTADAGSRVYDGPFPIFNTTVNLAFGKDLAYQERKGGCFTFTPLYCGYDVGWTDSDSPKVQFNGYTPTHSFAFEGGGPSMATAVATSGAALSPNWGYHSSPTMAFLLTIFNVRLGLWIRNPRRKQGGSLGSSPSMGLFYLLTELFGLANDDSRFVYLTDGGHFENMGLYELVRRRCSTIVICDAEQDSGLKFEGIGMAIRKCRIDFGAEIKLDLSKLQPVGEPPTSPIHVIPGTIHYPIGPHGEAFQGEVLYIKSTYTSKLPADLINYRMQHPYFPNDTTLNQWFTESQFESYRRLGLHYITAREVVNWFDNLPPRVTDQT
jgi:hypothetical protein